MPRPDVLKAEGITAVATTSDLIALPLLTRFQAAGFRVPGDFAITGFDDHRFSGLVAPGLTSVAQDTGGIAAGAIQSLIRQLETEDIPEGTTVAVRLIIRGSTNPQSNKEQDHEDMFYGG